MEENFCFLNKDDFWRDYNEMNSKGIKFVRAPKEEIYIERISYDYI